MRILIVDDDFVSRRLLKAILEPYGDCDYAFSGEEAVMAYKLAVKEKKPYGAIFLDVMMPGTDGYYALKEIRECENRRRIPLDRMVKIIMATGVDDPAEIIHAFKIQCDAYMVKPITPEMVKDAAKKAGLVLRRI